MWSRRRGFRITMMKMSRVVAKLPVVVVVLCSGEEWASQCTPPVHKVIKSDRGLPGEQGYPSC